jgi:hypothetical protein
MRSPPCVLVVADPGRIAELANALSDPFPQGVIEVLVSTGGDDTIDIFEARSPRVVVLTASLEVGDTKSLIETLRDMVAREELSIVLVGDDTGPIRNALDAIDMKPDRFVSRPLAPKALRFAVQSGLEMVARALGEAGTTPDADEVPSMPSLARTPTPVRGSALIAAPTSGGNGVGKNGEHAGTSDGRGSDPILDGDTSESAMRTPRTKTDRGTGILRPSDENLDVPAVGRSHTDRGVGIANAVPGMQLEEDTSEDALAKRAALRARWEALADSMGVDEDDDDLGLDEELEDEPLDAAFTELSNDEAVPLPPPIEIGPRKKGGTNPDFQPVPPMVPWRPGTTSQLRSEDDLSPPAREPTLILHDEPSSRSVSNAAPPLAAAPPIPSLVPSPSAGADTASTSSGATAATGAGTTNTSGGMATATTAATGAGADHNEPPPRPAERWSHPVLLSELIDRSRESSRDLLAHVTGTDNLNELDDIDDDIIVGHPQHTPPPHVLRSGQLQALEDMIEPEMPPEPPPAPASPPSRSSASKIEPPAASGSNAGASDRPTERPGGRDFARQLRAKMSMMAQRLFQTDSPAQPPDHGPRHDHKTEIDLAGLGDEPVLGGGVTEIESRGRGATDARELSTTSPGSWDTQVREKGLPDSGEIVRGVSDAAMILARMFNISFTGRVGFRHGEEEKVVYFDGGRPVFASSNETGDRMGELLVREGKITASQYERCQIHVEQSGRRMGEILVDFGYLKRRELLPAVRRHVEDIIYSLFGWDNGHYHVTPDPSPSAERIRLSRHPASLILEGIRRKHDRTTLEKVLGNASTIIEVRDRERVSTIINASDLAQEERAALAAFDAQADLAQVARTTGVDVADVLPLAWGLVVLGLATARRTETDHLEESTALVGETDLAIDRERVRARWQLVTEADYFALLGVRRDATTFEIRRAYQAARRDFAADCFPQDLRRELARELEDIAAVLDEAFRVLRDDRLRQTYLANLVDN